MLYSLGFAAGALGLVLSNLLNARLAHRVPAVRMMRVGTGLLLLAGVALTVATLAGWLTIPLFIVCAFILSSGAGFTMSNSSALGLGVAKQARGAGAALLGAAQFACGGLASPVVGAWGEHTALPMAVFVLTAAALAFAGAMRRGLS